MQAVIKTPDFQIMFLEKVKQGEAVNFLQLFINSFQVFFI